MTNLPRLSFLVILSAFQFFSISAFSQSIPSAEAKDNVGQNKTVTGTVMKVTTLAKTVVLEIDGTYPNAPFTGLIFNEKLPNFDKAILEGYQGKSVAITGKIALYKDKPQIILSDPAQIALSTAAPAAPAAPNPAPAVATPAEPSKTTVNEATPPAAPVPATPSSPAAPASTNLLSNGGFNKGKKDWDIPEGSDVIADGESQVLKIVLKPGEAVILKQEIKKFPKDAKSLQASFSAKLSEGAKLNGDLTLHLGADLKSGSQFSQKMTATTGSYQELKWSNIKNPQGDSVTLFLEIPAGEGSVLLDNFHLAP